MSKTYDFTVYVEAESENDARSVLDLLSQVPGVRWWELNDGNQDDDETCS